MGHFTTLYKIQIHFLWVKLFSAIFARKASFLNWVIRLSNRDLNQQLIAHWRIQNKTMLLYYQNTRDNFFFLKILCRACYTFIFLDSFWVKGPKWLNDKWTVEERGEKPKFSNVLSPGLWQGKLQKYNIFKWVALSFIRHPIS